MRSAGIPLIGPNCLGVINTDPAVRMNAAFGRKMPGPGNLAFLSQSGALCTSVLDYAEERHMGFSKFISFGNKADVNEIDLLDYLARDPTTDVIAMYLEDISDGRRFIETVREIFWETHKPMLCLKSGRTPEGAKAVSSHTGSLAGSDSVYDALLVQSGVQRVDTIAELFDSAALYCTQPLPRGGRVAIVTNAGGPGIMATDAAVRFGLKLAELSPATQEKLKASLPATASLRNPIDVIGDARADRYRSAVRTVLEDDNVDMGMVILTPQSMTDIEETAAVVPDAVRGIKKPVVCAFMGAKDVAPGVNILRKAGIPNYPFPEDAIRSLAAAERLVALHEIPRREMQVFQDLDVEKAKGLIAAALDGQDQRYLTQAECRPLLECYRLPLLRSAIVADGGRGRASGRVVRHARRDEGDVGGRGPQVRRRRRAAEYPRGGRSLGRLREDRPECHSRGAGRQDPGDSDRRDGSQGRRSDFGRQPRCPLRTADDVRVGRHAGRGPQGRLLPLGADVEDLGRTHGPPDSFLQGAGRLPRQPAGGHRGDCRYPAPAVRDGLQSSGDLGVGHQPADRPCSRPGLLGGRQPGDAPPAVEKEREFARLSPAERPGKEPPAKHRFPKENRSAPAG